MNARTLIGLWKANVPPWVWICFPLWIGPIILGLDGRAPEWLPIALFLATVTVIMSIAEFANTYADRDEDWLYGPTNPLVAGELNAVRARNTFILQNILAGLLLVALLVVVPSYALAITMIVGWFAGIAYSLPPFRFKETVAAPFFFALGLALLPVVAWLSVEPSLTAQNGFIIAFAVLLFVHSFGFEITLKFRKTYHAFNAGLIRPQEDSSVYNISTVGLRLKVRTAMAIEALTTLAAFALVPIFWHLRIFDMALLIGLLALPLPLTALAVVLRMKDPIKNARKCMFFMSMAWVLIVLLLFAVALSSLIHWGFALLACIAFVLGFVAMFRAIHPFGAKALAAPWREI